MTAAGPECSRDPCQRDWSLSCLRNCQTSVALLVFLVPRIALCQAMPTEPLPQGVRTRRNAHPNSNPDPATRPATWPHPDSGSDSEVGP